jgi:iron complex transport system permease protein
VVLAVLVGAALSVVGAVLQTLVRNPLADPFLFGITSGASTGAVLFVLLGVSFGATAGLTVGAFAGALVSLAAVLLLASGAGGLSPLRVLLAGVAVAYVLAAVTSLLVFVAASAGQDGAFRQVLFWTLGGLGGARWSILTLPLAAVVVGLVVLLASARTLNVLLTGDDSAASMGVDVARTRLVLFVLCALMTAVAVAVAGGIGFVGLLVPHGVRLLVGSDHRRVLPLCAVVGGTYLVLADLAARTVVAPQELPIGILTALTGAPLFFFLLRRRSTDALSAGVP